MGIYIFSWEVLKESLIAMSSQSNCDLENILSLTVMSIKNVFLPTNSTGTGRMWARWALTGRPTWN